MSYSSFLTSLRQRIWPFGEALELQADHNARFVDALVDLQSFVPCLKQDQTDIVPHCNTVYNCGLTVLEAPIDEVVSLSVVDRVDQTTHKENAASPIDWCCEIPYRQIDSCHIRSYLSGSQKCGCCLSIPFFFDIPADLCAKARFPIPTDVGVSPALPILPLGFHYAQTSTDRLHGRARAGVWAIERGKIWIAPWIQSTETVIIKWDGIKRQWGDDDPISDDPMLAQAVEEYARWKHADKWDKDESEMIRAQSEYIRVRAMLIRQCREATRVRECGGDAGGSGSQSRSSPSSITQLFFNSEQKATAQCPPGFTGTSITETIPAGTVSSTLSKADADQKAKAQAQAQATSRLDCTAATIIFKSEPVTATATCVQEVGAPAPEGNPVTVSLPAGTATSTVSVADATAIAQQLAQGAAEQQLSCTFWNRAQTVTVTCASDNSITATSTVAAHTYSSHLSQADADAQALTAATNAAHQSLADQGCADDLFWNTPQSGSDSLFCGQVGGGGPPVFFCHPEFQGNVVIMVCEPYFGPPKNCTVHVTVNIPAHYFSSPNSQNEANQMALDAAVDIATQKTQQLCAQKKCGDFIYSYPLPL